MNGSEVRSMYVCNSIAQKSGFIIPAGYPTDKSVNPFAGAEKSVLWGRLL